MSVITDFAPGTSKPLLQPPGIFVQRLVLGTNYVKHIERVTTRPRAAAQENK
eukprot:gene12468-16621_t